MPDKWFTPATASQALHELRPAAEAMRDLFREMERRAPPSVGGDRPVDPGYFALLRALQAAFREIRSRGVQVKDPRIGLLDFPARRAGRTVLLCWKVGEPRVAFWHEPEAGFAGRLAVDEDGPWDDG
jgi:hypothetical protein